MFEDFTDRARKVVVLAQAVAEDSALLPHHVLSGILQEAGSLASRTMTAAGLDHGELTRALASVGGPGSGASGGAGVGMSDPVLRLFADARTVMQRLGHTFVTPEHLTIALLSESTDEVLSVFVQAGVEAGEMASTIMRLVSVEPTSGDPRRSSLGRMCEKCGASIEEYGRVKDLKLGIEDRDEAIDLHAYFCGECGSAYGLVKD